MKVNKWTMGLAAAGLVSLPLMVTAEEKAVNPVMSAVSGTTISGYVDTSAHWNPGTGNTFAAPFLYNQGKSDGFNLNKVKLRLDKALSEENWSSGYRVDMLFGPDADVFATQSNLADGAGDFAIQQAYVVLGAPVRNGLEFKMGVFDSIIGYESHDSVNDPNYTRSYATSLEPHTHTGLLASYRFADWFGVAAGVANTIVPTINEKAYEGGKAESAKTYMASAELAAPDSMGFLAGSKLFVGFVTGFGGPAAEGQNLQNQDNFYLGATLNTPMKNLKVGGSFDYVAHPGGIEDISPAHAYAGYLSYQMEKWGFHARAEYAEAFSTVRLANDVNGLPADQSAFYNVFALTGTVSYDLWKNVLTRFEVRWDHATDGNNHFGQADVNGDPQLKNSWLVAANVIYKF